MYEVKPYSPRIRLIGNDGSVVEYACWDEFLANSDYWFLNNHLVTKFNDPRDKVVLEWYFHDLLRKLPHRIRYVVRDEFGSVFSRNEVLEAIAERNRIWSRKKYSWFYNRHNFIYRKTPVPYTKKRGWRFKSVYRRPKTTQEKRLGYENTEYIRGKRRPHSLIDAWEDVPRSDIRIKKSWKKFRKTQYKERTK